jgi:hypothetical protein
MEQSKPVLFALLFGALVLSASNNVARGDAIPDTFDLSDVIVKKAKPLSPRDSYDTKFLSYQSAKDDHDFRRFATLFEPCAEAGDALCQYFLADGVAEWLYQDVVPHDRKYGPKFVRKWLRRSSEKFEAYGFVTLSWSAFYGSGALGYPHDEQLEHCWREVNNSNNDMSKVAVQKQFNKCKALEKSKFGMKASWLKG